MADTIRIKALNLGSCNGCDIEILDLFRREPKFSAVESKEPRSKLRGIERQNLNI